MIYTIFNIINAEGVMITAEWIAGGIAILALFFFGIILNSFDKRIDKSEKKTDDVVTNYNDKFNTTHEKLDVIVKSMSDMLLEIRQQALFCKMVQKQKGESDESIRKT